MKNDYCNLKKTLENYFEKRIGLEDTKDKFDKLILSLDNQYKLSDIYDFDANLVVDKEHHNKFYRFDYTLNNTEADYDTTIYIYFIFDDKNSKNFGIVFDEVTIGERDYPYGKTTTFLLDETNEINYYDFNKAIDVEKSNNYIKKLIKI